MDKIAIVTNIPAPYRVDLFYYMQTHLERYGFYVIYTNKNEDNRQWTSNEKKLLNSIILNSKMIKIKGELDDRYIHLPTNIIPCLNRISPDVIIAFEYNLAALQCLAWCKFHAKGFIHLTDGTMYSERNISKIQRSSRKIIMRNADAYIASSLKAKEKLIAWGCNEKKIFTSLLTIDTNNYEGIVKETFPGRILYVGSMAKRKGLDLLIKALPYLHIEYDLHIVGNGMPSEIEVLKKLAEDKGVAHRITWCGYKEGNALIDEYRQAQAFVLPTREDCFGLVLVEAYCARIPIVASKYADGAYDVVADGKNGYIVDPYDSRAFAQALGDALMDEKIMEGARRSSLDKFRFKNVSKGYIQALEYAAMKKNPK